MAEVITSGKVIQKPDIVIDASDFLPPNLLQVRTQNPDSIEDAGDSSDESIGEGRDVTGEDDEDSGGINVGDLYPSDLPVPQDMRIISQTMRVGEDKKITVDVIIETSDIPGIREYEVRYVKSQL